jgi:undecaprenyl-diphosphatase
VKDIWNIYYRPRPFAEQDVKLLFYRPSVSSFLVFQSRWHFVSLQGALANRRLGAALLILAALFAIARVYAGVHYPLDVIAGATIGAGTVHIVRRLKFVTDPVADRAIALARRFYFA